MSVRLCTKPHTYDIQEVLGESPLSLVYSAYRFDPELKLKQSVVIKVFKNKKLAPLQMESLLKARHSLYLVKVLAFDYFQSLPALVLEHIKGLNLKQLLQTHKLSQNEKNYILAQTLLGLQELKKQNLSHGDLSPGNILIDTRGQVLLTDYGLANYASHQLYATKPFNAPELSIQNKSHFLSDLFSLGVIEKTLTNNLTQEHLSSMSNDSFICDTHPLLNSNPQKRHLKLFKHSRKAMSSLSVKIKKCLKRKSFHHPLMTAPLCLKKKKPSWLFIISTGVASLICLSLAASSFYKSQTPPKTTPQAFNLTSHTSSVLVRTSHWMYIQLAGIKGYTPITIPLIHPGTYKIKWKTNSLKGVKNIVLKKGQTLLLTDKDFISSKL